MLFLYRQCAIFIPNLFVYYFLQVMEEAGDIYVGRFVLCICASGILEFRCLSTNFHCYWNAKTSFLAVQKGFSLAYWFLFLPVFMKINIYRYFSRANRDTGAIGHYNHYFINLYKRLGKETSIKWKRLGKRFLLLLYS